MRIPKFVAVSNKYFLNRLMRIIAGKKYSPIAMIIHTGRKSGKKYETPIIVSPVKNGFVLALTYGPNVDWYKNILAAKKGSIVWRGKTYQVLSPKIISQKEGISSFPIFMQPFQKLVDMNPFIKMETAGRS